jgi:hypothetical protein
MSNQNRLHLLGLALVIALPAVLGCQTASAAPDKTNELPFGFIDAPANGASVTRQVQMYGWALDDEGVTDVRLFVDGHFARSAAIDQARADVAALYPAYAGGGDVCGWAVTLTLGADLAPGPHTIIAQAVDKKGATRDIGSITVGLGS